MTLAFSSKHPYVPNPKEDPKATRWIASLSDGSTIFEDVTPQERSSWLRLRDYVELHDLKITNLRLEAYGRNVILIPYRDGEGNPQLNGYWHSKQISALMHAQGVSETECRGIGILKNDEIWITWVHENGTTRQEVREYRSGDRAVIVNDPPR
jgi:hypothetical protein